ncbi:MAG: ester cyclase [Candidatus Brocadia sp.]|nr:ester cyclase [Candidatus Brocadia sp.]
MDNVVGYEAKWIDGLNRGDVSVADEVFSPDCKIYINGSQKPVNLAEFIKQVKKDLANFPGRQFTIEDQIIADDKFVFRWVANSVSSSGKNVRNEGLIIDRVTNSKVAERWEQWDQPDDELRNLDRLAHACIIYLLAVGVAAIRAVVDCQAISGSNCRASLYLGSELLCRKSRQVPED